MLDKFRRFGLEIFSDHEVLEVLLYFAVRQGDTCLLYTSRCV